MNFYNGLLYGIAGALAGSFLNVCILRIPNDENFIWGRSHCPHCSHILSFYDLIPVLSWVFLGGKCRYCKIPISVQYPVVELLTGALFFLILLAKGPGTVSLLFCFFAALLILASFIDGAHLYIPDGIVLMILLLSLFSALAGWEPGWKERIMGFLFCGTLLGSLRFLTRGGIGMGDVKLLAACGLFLGWKPALLSVPIAYLLAGIWYMVPLLRGKVNGKTQAPMAPFFSVALFICGLWHEEILRWYFSFLT